MERFGLALHREDRQLSAYVLRVGVASSVEEGTTSG